MSNYFDHLNSVVQSPKNPYMQDCGELPVQMCRVDGGKLWRFLINAGYSVDGADTIMRDYFKINTYGKEIEVLVAEHPEIVETCEEQGFVDHIPDFLKRLLGSECYNGSLAHLLELIRNQECVHEVLTETLSHCPKICVKLLEMGVSSSDVVSTLIHKFGHTTTLTEDEVLSVLDKEGI